jgi:hypothetical protein
VDKVPKKVSFRDEKGHGYGIADIYYVEKIKDSSLIDSDDGSFACTCNIVWLAIFIFNIYSC